MLYRKDNNDYKNVYSQSRSRIDEENKFQNNHERFM